MFNQLYKSPSTIARHVNAPYAKERVRYLIHCAQRGDTRSTLLHKTTELLWVARKLSVYPDLNITTAQLHSAAGGWTDRKSACGRKLNTHWTRRHFIDVGGAWLRYLGYLRKPTQWIPFEAQLDAYCCWAKNERGLCQSTIANFRHHIVPFLRWYGTLERPLSDVRINDIDAYLAHGGEQGWCRKTIQNVATSLRGFFRYGGIQGWARPPLAAAIQGPRIYTSEGLSRGLDWTDVQRLFATMDAKRPMDVRDRAILMLMAIYGLRRSEVATLRLNHLDWEHDLLHIARVKRHETQVYPLLPSVGNAIVQYLEQVRYPSAQPEVFLTLCSPHRPLSPQGLYSIVAHRVKALNLRIAHYGPHSLRHACAARLVAQGLSLKEIGDHLGHRCTSATRIYAKVDLPGLREVAAFDLGELL